MYAAYHTTTFIHLSLAKLLCTEVFNESFNNSGLQSIYFLLLKKRIRKLYAWLIEERGESLEDQKTRGGEKSRSPMPLYG